MISFTFFEIFRLSASTSVEPRLIGETRRKGYGTFVNLVVLSRDGKDAIVTFFVFARDLHLESIEEAKVFLSILWNNSNRFARPRQLYSHPANQRTSLIS